MISIATRTDDRTDNSVHVEHEGGGREGNVHTAPQLAGRDRSSVAHQLVGVAYLTRQEL